MVSEPRGVSVPLRLAGAGSLAAALVMFLVPVGARQAAQEATPVSGMVISESARIKPGTYRLTVKDDVPAITIRGENLTVDFTGVTIEGGAPLGDPDRYAGVGILIEGGRGVTVRGATVRGYKVGLLARKSPALHLTANDFSYNWKSRLWSTPEHESLVDWLSYHDNDKDQWLRYGAAIYLAECDGAEVDNNRAVQGQNGLMVTRSAKLRIWNNTFSWMSGVGLGLYRATDSVIQHNRLDWNVRGYSHGVYNRGQDSAALLMYEQSSRNTVAYNSATHGGDGLFLWAGQSTLDSGKGGSNENRFVENDFSHAVANGIEATFSRNTFIGNRVDDCWHGVWAGYSYGTTFLRNTFSGNTEAIAIEHGQNIEIVGNTFKGDETAIRVWANAGQNPAWGYAKTRDTRSRDYVIEGNRFEGNKTGLAVMRTSGVRAKGNAFTIVATPIEVGADMAGLEFDPSGPVSPPPPLPPAPVRLAGAIDARLPASALRGRATILVDEWGPYDYRFPRLWPIGKPQDRPLKFRVLGPPGQWTLKTIRGGTTTAREGPVPGELTVTTPGRGADLDIALEYVGTAVVGPRGQTYAAGARVPFTYSTFDPPVDWTVMFWRVEPSTSPLSTADPFATALTKSPWRAETAQRLDYLSAGPLAPGVPSDGVVLRAEAVVQLPPGTFELSVTSDDGVRVWIDGKLVIDRWNVHESALDRVPIATGRRRLKVEYFEATGWAELQVRFWRKN